MSNWNRERNSVLHEASNTGFKGMDATSTGFAENWSANLVKTAQSDMAISKVIMEAPRRERNRAVKDLVRSGKIPQEVFEQFSVQDRGYTEIDYDGLVNYANNSGIASLNTDSEIDESIKSEVAFFDENAADVASRSTVGGKVGAFSGAMHAGILDPVNVAATFAIPAAGMGATVWQSIGKAAGVGFAGGLATEAVIQPFVYSYKNELGMNYTFKDAATNATLSAIMGASIGAAAGGLGHWYTDAVVKAETARKSGNIDAAEALEESAGIAKQMEVEARNAPDPEATPFDHDQSVGTRGTEIENGATHQNVDPVEQLDVKEQINLFPAEEPRMEFDVEIYETPDGGLRAVQGDRVLGEVESQEGGLETVIDVAEEARGQGVGKKLMKEWIKKDPFALSGGFTEAGQANRLSALRELKDEVLDPSPELQKAFDMSEKEYLAVVNAEGKMASADDYIKRGVEDFDLPEGSKSLKSDPEMVPSKLDAAGPLADGKTYSQSKFEFDELSEKMAVAITCIK